MSDALEAAKKEAMEMLTSIPEPHRETGEVSIAGVEDPEVWMGMGYLVGRGLAVYRGGYSFRLTALGWTEALREEK